MFNPLESLQKFRSRIGKPIRPVIEVMKEGSIVNIVTNSVQVGAIVNDTFHSQGWEVPANSRSSAIYVDGVFKGMGYFVGEEGTVLQVNKDVTDGKGNTITLSYSGEIGKLIDAAIIELGSALKPSMMQTLIYCGLVGLTTFMMGMSYGS